MFLSLIEQPLLLALSDAVRGAGAARAHGRGRLHGLPQHAHDLLQPLDVAQHADRLLEPVLGVLQEVVQGLAAHRVDAGHEAREVRLERGAPLLDEVGREAREAEAHGLWRQLRQRLRRRRSPVGRGAAKAPGGGGAADGGRRRGYRRVQLAEVVVAAPHGPGRLAALHEHAEGHELGAHLARRDGHSQLRGRTRHCVVLLLSHLSVKVSESEVALGVHVLL